MSKAYHVFLSYSRSDAAMMRRVTQDLRQKGFTIWNDEALEPGTDSWKTAIQTAIESSATVVVLLSPDAKKSEWIERELDYARAFKVPIIPVIIQGDTTTAVPFLLISVQRADMRHSYEAGLYVLQDALCDMLRLPELCADRAEQVSAADQAARPVPQDAPLPGQPAKFAGKLRVWNPIDYGRLILLYLFDPVRLYTYDPRGNRALAVWLTCTLFWLPLAINAVAFRRSDVPLWGLTSEPLAVFPVWSIAAAWLITGVIGQVHFDVRTGPRAFLRGPAQAAMIVVGLAMVVLYGGSITQSQPGLETRDGLLYLSVSQAQQLLIIAGGLSVFVGTILAYNLARGIPSWLGVSQTVGFVLLFGLVLYIPLGETMRPLLPPDTSQSDITARGIAAYSGVICCLGAGLLITATTVGGALRRRQVASLNFLLLLMLIAAYGIFAWVHLIGRPL